MDKYGNGEEIVLRNLGLTTELSFVNFTHDMLIRMCVLSGCDYLDSLPGIGIVNAYKIVRDYKSIDSIFDQLEKLFDSSIMPKNYKKNFIKAELTFKHQRVFDIKNQKLITLNELPNEISKESSNLTFLGPVLPPKIYLSICKGKMDPISFKYFDGRDIKDGEVVGLKKPISSPFMNKNILKIGISKKQKVNSSLIDKYLKSDETDTLSSFDSQKSSVSERNSQSQNEKENKIKYNQKKVRKESSDEEEEEEEDEEQESEKESEAEIEEISDDDKNESSDDEEEEEIIISTTKKRKNSVLMETENETQVINLVSEKRNLFDMIYKKKKNK